MRTSILLALALTGCTELVGIEDFDGPGDPVDPGETLAISGQLSRDDGEFGFPVLASTPVAFRRRDGSLLATTTSDANGNYAFLIATSSDTLAGFVEASAGSGAYAPLRYVDNMTTALSSVHLTGYLSTRLEDFAVFASATQTLSSGVVLVEVVDDSGITVAGATVDTHGIGTLRYHSDTTNLPAVEVTSTGIQGAAWIFGVTPGSITITARLGASSSIDRTIAVSAGTISRLRVRVP